MSPLAAALQAGLPAGFHLRDRTDADLPFLARLYASTREEELRPVPWREEEKLAFLADQFIKQHQHYLQHYPDALWLVIENAAESVGRIYLCPMESEIRLMDIALVPSQRNHGLGTTLVKSLLDFADRQGAFVSLHVEPYNPAMRLYQRLGFANVETRGYYQYMQSTAKGPAAS